MSHNRKRKQIRLKSFDYSREGAYFVTVCSHENQALFGEIKDGQMFLNEYGNTVWDCWYDLPNHYEHVFLDAFIVMPNHIHGIIYLVPDDRGWDVSFNEAGLKPAPTSLAVVKHGLSEIVRALKIFSARKINYNLGTIGEPVWQRNYHERIICNNNELNKFRKYIMNNSMRW